MEDDEFTDIQAEYGLVAAIEGLSRSTVRHELASLCAAALGDPDVDEAAKSLSGFWLQRLGEDVEGG